MDTIDSLSKHSKERHLAVLSTVRYLAMLYREDETSSEVAVRRQRYFEERGETLQGRGVGCPVVFYSEDSMLPFRRASRGGGKRVKLCSDSKVPAFQHRDTLIVQRLGYSNSPPPYVFCSTSELAQGFPNDSGSQ